jgi:hypothetical protein
MNCFKHIALILSFGSFVLFSCKKYPEDSKRYLFDSPEKRIVGTWLLTNYYMNNADSTTFLYNQYDGYNYAGTPTPVSQYGNLLLEVGVSSDKSYQYGATIYSIGGSGNMSFENDKNYLKIDFTVTGYKYYPATPLDTIPVYNLFVNVSNWNIRELTKTNLKINNTINNTNYSIEFTKQ